MPQPTWTPPPIPEETVQEGARWRHHRPSSEQVAEWFGTQPIDEGMAHDKYVGGVVIIPQSEKVKLSKPDGGTLERHEQVFTPYVQIGTRVAYFRHLAEYRELIPWNGPADVPRSEQPQSPYFNANMPKGMWWHVIYVDRVPVRYLCCTWEVAMYDPVSFAAKYRGQDPMPVLVGTGTKQVGGGPDPNGLMRAQTGAYGRALGAAGILVVGTGIATSEDMQEFSGLAAQGPAPGATQLPAPTEVPQGEEPPPPMDAAAELESLRARALALQAKMQEERPESWQTFAAWWRERSQEAGWRGINDVPAEALKGVVARMERESGVAA